MDIALFVRRQLVWAKKHTNTPVDEAKADWWLKKITEVAKLEAEVFPPEPPAHAEHPGQLKAS